MHPSLAKLPSQERAALAYAQVVMAIEHLVKRAGSGVARPDRRGCGGRRGRAAVAEAVGVPFAALPRRVEALHGGPAAPEGRRPRAERLRFKDDPKHGGAGSEWAEIPDAKARGFARLGEISGARPLDLGAGRVREGLPARRRPHPRR